MNSAEIIRKSWSFYKTNFKRLWPLFLLGSSSGFGIYSLIPDTDKLVDYADAFSTPIVLIIVSVMTVISIFIFLSHIALIKTISNTYKRHIQDLSDSYKVGQDLFLPALFATVIYDLSTQGATLLLIIPGIIIGGYLVFYLMEFVDQNKRGMDALLSSWAIVDGRWWEVFWMIVVTGFLIIFPYLIIVSVIGISGVVVFTMLQVSGIMSLIAASIFGLLLIITTALLVIPVGIISLFEIYYYFRNSRENKRIEKTDKDRILMIKISASVGILYLLFEILNRIFHFI